MSQLHVGDQQFFSQYAPDSEVPLSNRVFSIEYEQSRRQRGDTDDRPGDFTSPMQFNISMNNELYFLRSCNLRLPVTAQFVDEFGNRVRSQEEVAALAIRNRPGRAFQKITTNLNSHQSTRNPDDTAWEEYFVTDDEYGLNLPNEGPSCVPLNEVQLTCATQVGTQQTRSIGSAPVGYRYPSEENPNFATRARQFAEKWNYDEARWEGDITIPLECGVHRPYSSKKATRTKFIPYIGQEQIMYEWKKQKAEFDYKGSKPDTMQVAKYLFEQSNRLHQSARDAPIARQVGQTAPFSLWLGFDMAFMIVPHDVSPVMGAETQKISCHADVCARFPPGSTVEWDAVAMSAQARAAGQQADQGSFLPEWFKTFKVFRVQDCTLGAVGGLYGAIHTPAASLSASTNVQALSSCGSGAQKLATYIASLSRAAANNTTTNATHGTLLMDQTFAQCPVNAGNNAPAPGVALQLGKVLCERSSVVIFTRDSFQGLQKADHQGNAILTRAAWNVFTRDAGAFPVTECPQAYFAVRRYKERDEATAGAGRPGVTLPDELYGQPVAVELARSGVKLILGQQYNDAVGADAAGAAAAGIVGPAVAGVRRFGQANHAQYVNTVFASRFEAKEGAFPPTMTIAGGVPTPMTAANLMDQTLAGRWDTFEVQKFVCVGNSGGAVPTQLDPGMNGAMNAFNALPAYNVNAPIPVATLLQTDSTGLIPAILVSAREPHRVVSVTF